MSCNGCKACDCQPFGVEEHTVDGVFIKQMHIPKAATIVPQHSHEYDHTSMLARGSVTVIRSDARDIVAYYQAPAAIFIPAKVMHQFKSLENDTIIYCIHRERDGGAAVHEEQHLAGVS